MGALATDLTAITPLLARYFPADQQQAARCVLEAEVRAAENVCVGTNPANCVRSLPGPSPCPRGALPGPTTASGLFGIREACWDPAVQADNTPFTPATWDARLDPETNVWMASVIFSVNGWRAWPTSCVGCASCGVRGQPVAHPRGLVSDAASGGTPSLLFILGGLGLVGALVALAHLEQNGGLR